MCLDNAKNGYKRLLIFTLAITLAQSLCAQEKTYSIKGLITTNTGQILPFTTVIMYKGDDTSVYRSQYTDSAGKFIFTSLRQGTYRLHITQVGFEEKIIDGFFLTTQLELPPIQLVLRKNDLGAVVVQARTPPVAYKDGKIIVNVAANITMTGANGAELLERLPGISLDADGNILLKGQAGVRIMIDGVLINLSGAQLLNFLQTKQAQQIETIEIISSPTAQFDASGSAGVINIVTRKQKNQHLFYNFSGTLTQGTFFKNAFAGSAGFRKNKWTFFFSVNAGRNKDFARPSLVRVYPDPAMRFFYQRSDQTVRNSTVSINSSIEYAFSTRTSMGLSASLNSSNARNENKSLSSFNDIGDKVVFYSDFHGFSKSSSLNGGVNLNFRHDLDSSGKRFSADLDYFRYKQEGDHFSSTIKSDDLNVPLDEPFVLTGFLPSNYQIYSIKLDYTHPLSKFLKAGGGLKASDVCNKSQANYFIEENYQTVVDTSRTNHFHYREKMQAAYTSLRVTKSKWNMQVGMRMENTMILGHLLTNGQKFSYSYLQVFPSVFASYSISKKMSLGFNMSRRIDRPEYQDLNPFRFFVDLYTYRQGNYQLQPHYSKNIELTLTKSGGFIASVFYNHIENNITRVLVRSADTASKAAFQTSMNLGYRTNYGISVYYPVKFTRHWSANLNGQLFTNKYKGQISNGPFDQQVNSYTLAIIQTFKFKANLNAELSLNYRSPFLFGTFRNKSMCNLSFGLSRNLLNNKASIRFLFNDMLYTWKRRFTVDYEGMNMNYKRPNDTRYVRLAFTYSFNKAGRARPRVTSSDEERGRLIGSDN